MEAELVISEDLHDFCLNCIEKAYRRDVLKCSTASCGKEIWHDDFCDHLLGVPGSSPCCVYIDSRINQKRLNKKAPTLLTGWENRNYGIAVFRFTSTYFVFMQDNKWFTFKIPDHLLAEAVAHSKRTERYIEFTKFVAVPGVENQPAGISK